MAKPKTNIAKPKTVYAGTHLEMVSRGGWEYVRRPKISGIVGIVAVTDAKELILIRQFRPPLNADVIEIPAGLAGDVVGSESESLASAAKRELLEETGYDAKKMKLLSYGASSAGLCDEIIHLFLATGLKKVADADGDATERISTILVPLSKVEAWIRRQQKAGAAVDLKVFAALHFAGKA
jgi:ADP-ribose pyrophosphatase